MTSQLLATPAAGISWANYYSKQLAKGDIIAFYGDLGTGKTFLTQALCAALGVHEQVSSPTYVLLHEYTGDTCPIYHLDLYRLECFDELLELGMEEMFTDGITIIEWPEIAEALLPPHTTRIYLDYALESGRTIKIKARE